MSHGTLQFLDWFFIAFHTSFTLFNAVGWMFRKTRRAHLVTMGLTAASWFILGIWYGWGYCFCTDWHWQVRQALGRPIRFNSYIYFLIDETTGLAPDPALVDYTVLAVFLFSAAMTMALNFRDVFIRKKPSPPDS